ncbi:MAG: S1C family serine protease [Betaproteobacteria bacterium]|nr:S1C family serine protease [Betaproteobacteria bacterium]
MVELARWAFPPALQPTQGEVGFNLKSALDSVVALRAEVPDDAFTASILGTDRTGNGVVIRDDGLVLTIGYLITEAATVWLTANDGTVVAGHPLAYDFATGFGLVLPLGRLGLPALARGTAAVVGEDDDVYVIGHGGRAHALKATVFAKRPFVGYWEYMLDTALFTTPPHPEWSGAALLDEDGRLVGVGSLLLEERVGDDVVDGNMFVPIDLLEPIIDDLVRTGRSAQPPRPWLGMYTTEREGHLVVNGLAPGGPAERAGVQAGDQVVAVGGERVVTLADFLRQTWSKGPAGTEIALTLARSGAPVYIRVSSGDRNDFLRKSSLQ